MKIYTVGACLLATLILIGSTALAGQSSARSVAMGGAYTALAEGFDAARVNPGNLGLSDYQLKSVEIFGAGAYINNNSFTLSDYNTYTGALLTDNDKQYILSRIPEEGLKLSANAEAAALSVSSGQMAFTVTGVGVADVNLNKDIFELVLNGNTFGDTIDVTGSYSEAVSYVAAGVSYGRPIYNAGTRQLSIGGTVNYLRGIAHEKVTDLQGLGSTGSDGFFADGHMTVQTATGGTGFGIDLGAALQLNNTYSVALSIKNFISHLTWNNNAEEHRYLFNFDTTTIDNINGSHVTSEDTTVSLDSYSSSLPSVMTIGFAKRTGKAHWAVDWEQGFRRAAGSSSRPRLAAGVELTMLHNLPVRFGYAVGGERNAAFSFGSGFHLSAFHLDYAVVTGSSFSGYSTKGLNVAISTGLYF